MKDTTKEIEEKYRQMLMAKSGAERMKMASSMFETAKKFVEASLPEGLTEEEKRKAMIKRIYPELNLPRITRINTDRDLLPRTNANKREQKERNAGTTKSTKKIPEICVKG